MEAGKSDQSWRKRLYHGEEGTGRCSLEWCGPSIAGGLKNIRAIIPGQRKELAQGSIRDQVKI